MLILAPRRGPLLLDALLSELGGGEPGSFLVTLDDLLRQAVDAGGEAWAWHGVISALREQILQRLAGEGQRLGHAESLWHQARVLIGEYAWRAQADTNRHASQQFDRLHEISQVAGPGRGCSRADGHPGAAELPALGIGSCAVALYEDRPSGEDTAQEPAGACRLVLAYDEDGRAETAARWRSLACSSPGIGRAAGRRCFSRRRRRRDAATQREHPRRRAVVLPG